MVFTSVIYSIRCVQNRILFFLIFALTLISPVVGKCEATEDKREETKNLIEEKAVGFLNELSARRRVTTFFPNFQSPQLGVQENFVNTSEGNLTFLIRDLVVLESMPVVIGRVYDSRIRKDSDFGPGWKLSMREEVYIDGSTLIFVDASNSEYEFSLQHTSIVPANPALSPVVEGSLESDSDHGNQRLVLRSQDLVRQFQLIGDRYRLVRIDNGTSSISIEYSGELIERVLSGQTEIAIHRRSNNQIDSITDNHGRSVQFTYNDDGSLAQVDDRSRATWKFAYQMGSVGLLEKVVDPRGETVLEASYSKNRLTTRVQVLEQTHSFEYRQSITVMEDELRRTTTFEKEKNGLTSGVVNAMGDAVRVSFDDSFRPVELTRNSTKVAAIFYDTSGRVQMIETKTGSTRFGNGKHGVVTVYGDARANYKYDREGRVVSANDKFGKRNYEYSNGETKVSVFANKSHIDLILSERGVISDILQGQRSSVKLTYDAIGRVDSMTSSNFANVSYSYDERGLRNDISYGKSFSSMLSYDKVGNLINYSVSNAAGVTRSQKYEVDANNLVRKINSQHGSDRSEITFNYDELGRLWTAHGSNRLVEVHYDMLDRAEIIALDGEPVVAKSYYENEPDVVERGDKATSFFGTVRNASSVFGTVDSIMYTRPYPTMYGLIGYSSALKTFVVHEDAMVPDLLFLASLKSRRIPLDGSAIGGGPFQFDKPSNALFLPGEFRSLNCEVCDSTIRLINVHVIDAGTGDKVVRIEVTLNGSCRTRPAIQTRGPEDYEQQYTEHDWTHEINFGDGQSTTITTPNDSITIEHTYFFPGVYIIEDIVHCSCNSLIGIAQIRKRILIPGPCDAGQSLIDTSAIAHGQLISPNPWEEAKSLNCIGEAVFTSNPSNSNPANHPAWPSPFAADPCAVEIALGGAAVAGLHSHPVFTKVSQMNAGKGCRGKKDWDYDEVKRWRISSRRFGDGDYNFVRQKSMPLYLVYGSGSPRPMKVLNVNESEDNLPR